MAGAPRVYAPPSCGALPSADTPPVGCGNAARRIAEPRKLGPHLLPSARAITAYGRCGDAQLARQGSRQILCQLGGTRRGLRPDPLAFPPRSKLAPFPSSVPHSGATRRAKGCPTPCGAFPVARGGKSNGRAARLTLLCPKKFGQVPRGLIVPLSHFRRSFTAPRKPRP